MKTREQHIGKMEKKIQHWGTKLEALAADADNAGADLEVSYRHTVDELKLKYQIAQTKFTAMKDERGDKWDELREELNDAWHDLEGAFTKFTS